MLSKEFIFIISIVIISIIFITGIVNYKNDFVDNCNGTVVKGVSGYVCIKYDCVMTNRKEQ